MRKVLQPSTNKQDTIFPAPKREEVFFYGVIKDAPATDIPDGSIADGLNIICYPTEIVGRTGSELYTDVRIPAISGKSGYSASKSGNYITTTTDVFVPEDVGNFWVWPGETEEHDEILEIISTTQVRVAHASDRNIIIGCHIRGKNNFFKFHETQKKWVRQFFKDYYWQDIEMDSFEQIIIISRDLPSNVISDYKDFDDYSGVSFNSNGIFRMDFEVRPSLSYKINCPVPNIPIAAQDPTDTTTFAYRYRYSAARLIGNQIIRNRLTPTRIETEGGTNVEDFETNIAGQDKVWCEEPITTDDPKIVGPLWVPIVENTSPQEYQWHYTHYPIYRTLDIENTYARIGESDNTERAEYNNPERFVWVHDLRIMGAFWAYKRNGIITALVGMFEIADVGSTIEWDNGDRDEIVGYINSRQVRYRWSGEGQAYPEEEGYLRAACIGNGKVMRVTQSGDIITRTHGSTFTSADLRKTLQWANGYRSYVREVLDANRVRVYDSSNKSVQGITLDPRYRYFNDTITDFQLRSRLTEPLLLLTQRFWRPLRNCNIGILPPGFMVIAIRNFNIVYYCQLSESFEYLAGYHNPAIQLTKTIKDDIQAMWVFPDKFVVWSSGKTYHCPTNQPDLVVVPQVGEAVASLPGIEVLDSAKGCFDWGSIVDIGNDEIELLTSEKGFVGMRRFNGKSYGDNEAYIENLGMGRMADDLNELYHATAAIYNGNTGYILWGRETEYV